MKKQGKYDKKPEAGKALLQTYFTSLLSLVLCVAMFLGTSYAWFVSEVNNAGNEIYIGVLDVELEKQVKDEWKSLSATDAQEKITLFDNTVRWEPGHTALETVKVINKGDLAFRYVLSFTDGTLEQGTTKIEESSKLAQIAKGFDVWVYAHPDKATLTAEEAEKAAKAEAPSSFAEITAADSGWTRAGTLDQLLAGTPVLTGTMDAVRKAGQSADAINAGTTDGVKTEKLHTVALHMNKDADAIGMGHKISLNVKLVAYQMVSEQDDFGNGSYDEMQYISTTEGLIKAVEEAEDGDVIAVAGGTYDLTENPLVIEKSIALQGLNPNDKPVLQLLTGDASGIEIKADNVKLKDLILAVDPEKDSSGNVVQIPVKADGSYYSDIVIDGCEFSGSDHCIAFYGNDVTIRNCVMDETGAEAPGTLLQVWGATGALTVENNTFTGNPQAAHGITFTKKTDASKLSGSIRIAGNTFTVNKAVFHESDMTYTDVSVEILDNIFKDCQQTPVSIDFGSYLSYKVSGNLFLGTVDHGALLFAADTVSVDASGNYWGSEEPVWTTVLSGKKITVTDYYSDEAKTVLKEVTP